MNTLGTCKMIKFREMFVLLFCDQYLQITIEYSLLSRFFTGSTEKISLVGLLCSSFQGLMQLAPIKKGHTLKKMSETIFRMQCQNVQQLNLPQTKTDTKSLRGG